MSSTAIIHVGFVRATEDIDLVIDISGQHRPGARSVALAPGQAIDEMADRNVDQYVVVRIASEIVLDLMKSAWGIYEDDRALTTLVVIEASRFRSPRRGLLWKAKQTMRDKDRR